MHVEINDKQNTRELYEILQTKQRPTRHTAIKDVAIIIGLQSPFKVVFS